MKYLGHLSRKDPPYGYLRHDILSQLGANGVPPDFRVYSIPASNHVYTIFVDSNQGAKSYEDVAPDYVAPRFEDVLRGAAALN